MRNVFGGLAPEPLDGVLTNGFLAVAVVIGLAPALLLPMVERLFFVSSVDYLRNPLFLAVLAAFVASFVGLQVRVYRAVVRGTAPSDRLGVVGFLRDSVRTGLALGACFGVPAGLTFGFGIGPLEALAGVVSLPADGLTAASLLAVGYVEALLVGGYLFPAVMGVVAEEYGVADAVTDGRLVAVLRSHAYARYWLAAVGLGVLGLAGLVGLFVLGVLSLFVLFPLAVLSVPVGVLLAAVVGSFVSYLAATGYASALDDRQPGSGHPTHGTRREPRSG